MSRVGGTPRCRTYWGSHGCVLNRGHPTSEPHRCGCCVCEAHPDVNEECVGAPPYYGPETKFYGEDAQ
jgi:hypothetical protein